MRINNINDLIFLIKQNKFSKIQIIEIIEKTLNVFIIPDNNQNLIKEVKAYWSKYSTKPLSERPYFLNETKVNFANLMKSPTAKQINEKLEAYY